MQTPSWLEQYRAWWRRAPPCAALVCEDGAALRALGGTTLASLRILCCLSGNAAHRYLDQAQVVQVDVEPGQCLAVAPGGGLAPAAKRAEMLNALVAEDTIMYRRFSRSRRGVGHGLGWHVRSNTRGLETRALLAALAAAGRLPAGPHCDALIAAVWTLAGQVLDDPEVVAEPGLRHYRAACQVIDEGLGEDLDRRRVAAAVGIHPSHLSRVFTQHGTCGFSRHVAQRRLERAAELLRDPSLSLARVSELCGFSSQAWFIQTCRREYGCTPSALRQQ
ncbi:MAG: helix-turn-helix transcriptional regulator [Planctomycetota bacterium]|jgi:AraC-like DNA-binding protein|nr:helix-turn-helix transcriptional regulator [Planctomycetota bacterium]